MAVGSINQTRQNIPTTSQQSARGSQAQPVKSKQVDKTQISQTSGAPQSQFESKVENKFTNKVNAEQKFDHQAALGLARKVFAENVVGGVVDDKLKNVKSQEEALTFCHDLATSLVNNPRLDPEAKKAALQEIGKKFGAYYAPDNPQKAKAAGDWLFNKTFPDSLKNAKTEIHVSGFTPKEFAQQQLQSMLWAVGAADSPL